MAYDVQPGGSVTVSISGSGFSMELENTGPGEVFASLGEEAEPELLRAGETRELEGLSSIGIHIENRSGRVAAVRINSRSPRGMNTSVQSRVIAPSD